jgi:hypothetical protein
VESRPAEKFERRLWLRPVSHAVEINDEGLVFGAGTVLARMKSEPSGARVLALDQDLPRLSALLAAAYGRSPPSDLPAHLESAARFWQRGDKALANIRLAFARLPSLDDRAGAYRLFLAENLLEDGMSPEALMKLMGFDGPSAEFAKYDPAQPRVPSGSGRASGQWTSGGATPAPSAPKETPKAGATGAGAGVLAQAVATPGTLAEGLFGAGDSEFLGGLAALGLRIVGGAVLGALIVWPGKSMVSEGAIPGDPDLRYSLNSDEGVLCFLHEGDSGSETIAVAHQGRDGIFFEVETGAPVARMVGGSLVFDAASLADVAEETPARSGAETNAGAQSGTDQPQLCPDPGPDIPHGASPRSWAYQAQISFLNNPQRPLSPGLAVSLIDPTTGKRVVFDDCRESDGTMIEAKGPGFANLLRSRYFSQFILPERWTRQAARQIAASGGRDIEWFFAEPEAAAQARQLFADTPGLQNIKVIYVEALTP